MNFVLQPWQLLLVALAGWINRQQQDLLEFQRAEIQVLQELLGKKRLLLNDDQRLAIATLACLPVLNLGFDWLAGWREVIVYPGEFRVKREHHDEPTGVVTEGEDALIGEACDVRTWWTHGRFTPRFFPGRKDGGPRPTL